MLINKTFIAHKCSICGLSQNYQPLASMTEKYVAIECKQCRVVSAYPMPSLDELKEYYSNYHPTQETPERISELVELNQQILDFLTSHLESDRDLSFLDYGFGAAAFLKQVAKKGFSAYGVEFSTQNCEQIQKYCQENKVQIHTIKIPDESLDSFAGKKFDCITLFQVIEHVLDPLELLSSLSALQNPDGILYLECPNNDALFLKVKNAIRERVGRESFFDSLNPPQHIYGFNRHSMKVLLEKAGYTPIEIKDYYFGDRLHQPETTFWYPSYKQLKDRSYWNFYGFSKFLIGLFDPIASKVFRSGGGLYALARKNRSC